MKNILKQLFSSILPVTVLILVPLDIEPNISVHNISALVWKKSLKTNTGYIKRMFPDGYQG